MIDLELMTDPEDQAELRKMIERHVDHTKSRRGKHILDHWESCLPHFIKVFPTDYKRALGALSREDEAIPRREMERD